MIRLKVDLENDKAVKKAFTEINKNFPKEMNRAYLRAGSIIVRKIKSAVKNLGNKDTGKFAKLSEIRRALRSDPPGGVLTTLAGNDKETGRKGLCRVQVHGNEYYCGYITRLQPTFSRWQDGGNVDLSHPAVRHQLHRRLGKIGRRDIVIPESDVQPQRQVIEPITRVASENLPHWVIGALNKTFIKKFGHEAITTTAKKVKEK